MARQDRMRLRLNGPCVIVIASILTLQGDDQATARKGQPPRNMGGKTYYVSADARSDGDGSWSRPFLSLSQAESASAAGDTIYLLASESGKVLDGRIALKPRQQLLGVEVDGELLESAAGWRRPGGDTGLPVRR